MPSVSRRQQRQWVFPYTAGIIDGEGSVGIYRHKSKSNNSPGYYGLRVTVGNTNPWLIQFLKFHFGGGVTISRRFNPLWKDAWNWTIYEKQAIEFLKLILPYLQLKRPQAELAISFQSNKRQGTMNRRKGSGNKPMSNGEFAIQQAQAILMAKMNKRGKENESCS